MCDWRDGGSMTEPNPTIKQILLAYLKNEGFAGFFHSDLECGCKLDDPFLCDEPDQECECGYFRVGNPDEDCDWYICREKPAQHDDVARRGEQMERCPKCGYDVTGEEPLPDSLGNLPKPKTAQEALKEIRKIALDKRGHVLYADHCNWLMVKLKGIGILAYRGLQSDPDSLDQKGDE